MVHDHESIHGELVYLEHFVDRRPTWAPVVLTRLGELGEEGRADLPRLLAERTVKAKHVAALRRAKLASQAAAVAVLVAGAPALIGTPAAAANLPAIGASHQGNMLEVRIVDSQSGQPLSGVTLMTAAEELVGVTDANGSALVPAKYAQEPVISLERDGYPMVLVEGAKLGGRSMIAMRHFSAGIEQAKTDGPVAAMAALARGPIKPIGYAGEPALAAAPAPQAKAPAPVAKAPAPVAKAPVAKAPAPAPVAQAPVEAPAPVAKAPVEAPKAPMLAATTRMAPPIEPLQPFKPAATAEAPAAPFTTAQAPAEAPAPFAKAPAEAPVQPFAKAPVEAKAPDAERTALAPAYAATAPKFVAPPAAPQVASAPTSRAQNFLNRLKPADLPEDQTAERPVDVARNAGTTPAAAPAVQLASAPKPGVNVKLPARSPRASQRIRAAELAAAPPAAATVAIAPENLPMPAMASLPTAATQEPAPGWTVVTLPSQPRPAAVAQAPKPTTMAMAKVTLPSRPRAPQVASVPTAASTVTRPAAANYRVKAGDTLSDIALRELGSSTLWHVVYDANRDQLTNPRWLEVGLTLKIPRGSEATAGGQIYVVRNGDSLSKIARVMLGDMKKWRDLYAANKQQIRDPWFIFPGQRLVLPGTQNLAHHNIDNRWATLRATVYPPA